MHDPIARDCPPSGMRMGEWRCAGSAAQTVGEEEQGAGHQKIDRTSKLSIAMRVGETAGSHSSFSSSSSSGARRKIVLPTPCRISAEEEGRENLL